MCITSVIPLFLLIAFSEMTTFPIVPSFAIEIGVFILFLAIAIAVYLFIRVKFENAPHEFLEKEPFKTEYGVIGYVKERQNATTVPM